MSTGAASRGWPRTTCRWSAGSSCVTGRAPSRTSRATRCRLRSSRAPLVEVRLHDHLRVLGRLPLEVHFAECSVRRLEHDVAVRVGDEPSPGLGNRVLVLGLGGLGRGTRQRERLPHEGEPRVQRDRDQRDRNHGEHDPNVPVECHDDLLSSDWGGRPPPPPPPPPHPPLPPHPPPPPP